MIGSSFFRLLSYLKRSWPYVLGSTLAIISLSVIENIGPIVIRAIIDEITLGRTISEAIPLIMIFVGIAVISGIIRFLSQYGNQYVSNRLAVDLRDDVFRGLQAQSFVFYDKARTGQLMARVTSDVDEIRGTFGWMIPAFSTDILTLAISIMIMVSLIPDLSIYSLIMVPVLFVISARFADITGPLFSEIRKAVGNLSEVVQENLAGAKIVRVFSSEFQEMKKFDQRADHLLKLSLKLDKERATYLPLLSLVVGVTTASVIYLGGIELLSGRVSVGSLVAFVSYLNLVARPMRMFGFWIERVRRAMAGANRIFEILDAPVAIQESPNAIDVNNVKGEVRFEDVSFQYADVPTLSGVNLSVMPGEKVAVVGKTGSGKTTVLNLISRFYDATEGRVLIDGIDVREIRLKSLRKIIGIIPQEAFIFPTTIRDNITLGEPTFTQEQVENVAKAAQIHEFIASLPEGYDTIVGERGITLSGGQRQRISIARTLLRGPKIILLDDSTSQVDVATEREIDLAVQSLLKDKTAFIITNRISSASRADRVIVLDKGRIVAIGKHDELIHTCPIYREIFKGQIPENDQNPRRNEVSG